MFDYNSRKGAISDGAGFFMTVSLEALLEGTAENSTAQLEETTRSESE